MKTKENSVLYFVLLSSFFCAFKGLNFLFICEILCAYWCGALLLSLFAKDEGLELHQITTLGNDGSLLLKGLFKRKPTVTFTASESELTPIQLRNIIESLQEMNCSKVSKLRLLTYRCRRCFGSAQTAMKKSRRVYHFCSSWVRR